MSYNNEILRAWSYHRQHLERNCSDPTTVLRDVIAVYSAHPSGPLSLRARVRSFMPGDFRRLDNTYLALRLPAMRLSVHMLPRKTAGRIFSAVVPPPDDNFWIKNYSRPPRAMSVENYTRWKTAILNCACEPRSIAELREAAQLPTEQAKIIVNRVCNEGELLRLGAASLKANTLRYITARTALGTDLDKSECSDALVWLAGEYLRAFGPARAKDFQWWAGIGAAKARAAMAAQDAADLGGGLLLRASDITEFTSFKPNLKDSIAIIPQWDCYTMAYAPDGRERFVQPAMQEHLYGKLGATTGNGLGAVLINGQAQAVWTARFSGSTINIHLRHCEKPGAKQRKAVTTEFGEIATFLGAKKMEVTEGTA